MSTPEPSSRQPAAAGRVSTGSTPLDTMLQGGLLANRPYLVVGPSGTGKTTLALQFLVEGVRRGERCLLVTLEEPPNEVRQNHRGLLPELDQVFVFDAIPDVMRYERAPFKDIAQVRESVPFALVPAAIRKTAELASVEVTFSALEQTLKMEVARRGFSRIVIDSLTALQYFCMKGFDETLGAQTFLRFLSDLRITTLLTVESPLEGIESPERLLARGEIRLFRWEFDGKTVRAVGVEKFRGSEHDARLHPYRISAQGLDINLGVTISRDTHQVLPSDAIFFPPAIPEPEPEPADGVVRLAQDAIDLAGLGVPTLPVLEAIDASLREARGGRLAESLAEVGRARGLVLALFDEYRNGPGAHDASLEARRLAERVASVRAGVPPSPTPSLAELLQVLERLSARLHALPTPTRLPAPEPPAPRPAPLLSGPGSLSGPSMTEGRAPGARAYARPVAPHRVEPPPLPTRRITPPEAPPGPPATEAVPPSPPAPGPPPALAAPPLEPASARERALTLPAPSAALPTEVTGSPPPVAPTAPEPLPPPAAPAPKRRRRSLSVLRRRAPKPLPVAGAVTASGSSPELSGGVASSTPSATGEPGAPAAEAVAPAEPKPKRRRAPSRKKAPPVTAAAPGAPPPEDHRLPPPAAEPGAPAEPAAPPPAETPPPESDPSPTPGGSG